MAENGPLGWARTGQEFALTTTTLGAFLVTYGGQLPAVSNAVKFRGRQPSHIRHPRSIYSPNADMLHCTCTDGWTLSSAC